MSDTTGLTVPPAGWYPDRNEANLARWWDGQQWTDQTQSTAPAAAAFDQPVSAAAFGFSDPAATAAAPDPAATAAPAPAAPAAAPSPGWYPDNRDPSLQRWWDGREWTAHTTPTVPLATLPASAVNSIATRGMIYSLIGLVLNPFAMMSIGGFVLGVRALRRVPQFAPQSARRGPAIAAIVLGAIGTVVTVILIIGAVTTAVTHARLNSVHVFDRQGAERHLVAELATGSPNDSATSVSCPPDPAMKAGDRFDCTATLGDGRTMPVHITIDVNGGAYTYSWTANRAEATGRSAASPLFQADHPGSAGQYPLQDIEQSVQVDVADHYGVAVSRVDCPADSSVAPDPAPPVDDGSRNPDLSQS